MPGDIGKIKSEAQRKYLFAAEKRGELPKGKAEEMAHKVKGKHLPKKLHKGKKTKKSSKS
jgi:hypothetical protein